MLGFDFHLWKENFILNEASFKNCQLGSKC
jgi:hypothetical protein